MHYWWKKMKTDSTQVKIDNDLFQMEPDPRTILTMEPLLKIEMAKVHPECIYIATRLSPSGDARKSKAALQYLYNLKQSFIAAAKVWRKGHYPFVPGLDYNLFLELNGDYGVGGPSPYEASLEWMRRCDAILIYNGLYDSTGVQAEVAEAERLGLKVYVSLDEIQSVST